MIGIIIITLTAFLFGIVLVMVDNKESNSDIINHLPGLNCSTCGFGSCKGMAEAIKKDKMNYLKCKPLIGEKKDELEKFLGIENILN